MEDHKQIEMPVSLVLGWGVLLVGWLLAGVYATGVFVPRLLLVFPFVVIGSVVILLRSNSCFKKANLFVFIGMVYFIARASFSEVTELAKLDICLVGLGGLSFFSAQSVLGFRKAQAMLLLAGGGLFFGNFVVSMYQLCGHSSYAWLNTERIDVEGVSGFYYHRNYLSGFYSLFLPVCVGVLTRTEKVGAKGLLWGIILVGCVACYLTNSRGGFLSTILASTLTWFLLRRSEGARPGRYLKLGVKVFLVLLGVVLLSLMWGKIIQARGDWEGNHLFSRLAMAGIAFEVWISNFWFGLGGGSYSYEFPRRFSGMERWVGDAKFAHNDYLQTLADYGLIGFVLLFSLICSSIYFLRPTKRPKDWLVISAVCVLIGEIFRATFDFNLRILPNLMLFMILLGGAYGIQLSKEPGSRVRRLFEKASLLGTVGWLLFVFWPQIVNIPLWLKIEQSRLTGQEKQREELLSLYSERAPEFEIVRQVARVEIEQAIFSGERDSWRKSVSSWRRVLELHPKDGESLSNYARSLDELGEFEKAENYHRRALVAVGRRENKYGALYGVGLHLARRAELSWRERKSKEALFLFEEAQLTLQESRRRGYRPDERRFEAIAWVGEKIEFLKGAKVKPREVPFLDWRSVLDG